MSAIRDAIQVLETAEESLRALVGGAAKEGDYDAVLQITGWAKGIHELLPSSETGNRSAEVPANSLMQNAAYAPVADGGGSNQHLPVEPRPVAKSAKRRSNRTNDYPKYFRNENVLIKLGWSKSQKSEYEHKAPFSAIEELAKSIRQISSKKRRFAMDEILPVKNSVDGQEIPSYQTYACLGWLRQAGLIVQHGRQGYSVKPNTELDASVQQLFKRLPEQRHPAGQS